MNIVFNFAFIVCLCLILFINPNIAINTMINASEKAVNLCISLISIYALWLGLLEIVEKSGLNKKIAKILSPIIKLLFGKQNSAVNEQLAINLSSNMLGLGNASTPSGIKAMQLLDKGNGKITKPMTMLMVLNSMSIQIIPSTLIGLRIAYHSNNATNIILPILISSFVSTFFGVLLVKIFVKETKNESCHKTIYKKNFVNRKFKTQKTLTNLNNKQFFIKRRKDE